MIEKRKNLRFQKIISIRILLLFILVLVGSLKIKRPDPRRYPIPFKNLRFEIMEVDKYGNYIISVEPIYKLPCCGSGVYYLHIQDNHGYNVSVYTEIFYNPKIQIMFGRYFFAGKEGIFKIGEGKIINGRFNPIFPKGTRFYLDPCEPAEAVNVASITISLPYSLEEMKIE